MDCVSLDLDGTLLNSKRQITEETKQMVYTLKEKGIDVIINTGRMQKDIVNVKELAEIACPLICLNGSMIYSESGEILYETTLSLSLCKRLISELTDMGVGVLVYTNQGGFPATLPKLYGKSVEEINAMFQNQDYDIIFSLDNIKVYKLIAWVDENNLQKVDDVKIKMANEDEVSYSSSHPNNVEITSVEAQKGRALKRYEQIKGYTYKNIYSFGDGGNDVSQFEVSTVSFAMENSPEEIKGRATHITKSNDDDGVVYAIKHILKLV